MSQERERASLLYSVFPCLAGAAESPACVQFFSQSYKQHLRVHHWAKNPLFNLQHSPRKRYRGDLHFRE